MTLDPATGDLVGAKPGTTTVQVTLAEATRMDIEINVGVATDAPAGAVSAAAGAEVETSASVPGGYPFRFPVPVFAVFSG